MRGDINGQSKEIKLARAILNRMLVRCAQNDTMQQSMTLQLLLEDEIALQKCDEVVINKIINTYGPFVCNEEIHPPKLTTPLINSTMKDKCLKCQGCQKSIDVEIKH